MFGVMVHIFAESPGQLQLHGSCRSVLQCDVVNRKTYIAFSLLIALRLAYAQSRPAMTRETFDQWMTELSNWGRWGKDDELGAVNLITAAKRKQAAGLV